MKNEIIKPLNLPEEVTSAELQSVTKKNLKNLEGVEIIFDIIMPGTMTVKLTFPYSVSCKTVLSDIAYAQYGEDDARQDESGDAAFTVIENSSYINRLMTNKDLDFGEDLIHYKLWFREDVIDIIAYDFTFEVIKDWSLPYAT